MVVQVLRRVVFDVAARTGWTSATVRAPEGVELAVCLVGKDLVVVIVCAGRSHLRRPAV